MQLFIIATFLFGCSHCSLSGSQKSFPRVRTDLGIFEGFYNVSDGGQKYEAYEGIRFALPPTGKYRFKMARKVTEPWKGIVNAKSYGPSCVQSGAVPNLQGGARADNEDCLFLNVYTPIDHCRPKPGSFERGKKPLHDSPPSKDGEWSYPSDSSEGNEWFNPSYSNEPEGWSDSRHSSEDDEWSDLRHPNEGERWSDLRHLNEEGGWSDLRNFRKEWRWIEKIRPSKVKKWLYENLFGEDKEWSDPNSSNKVKRHSCSPLPVIIFIHGGAFRSGNTMSYRPTYIMNLPVIFVQITYRLGVLGFLSTQDDVVPGNLGLKDQVVAMRWVHENIRYFGGDPERITIVGQSAGGASVHYHFLTDVTEKLFQSGMSLSGTALNCWTETEAAGEKAEQLAALVNCSTSNTREMVDCMRNRTDIQLVQASTQFSPWVYNPITPFGPTVEKWNGKGEDGEFIMIDRLPYESLKEGRVQKKPWITSVVSEDGLFPAAEFLANETLLRQLNDHWDEIAPILLDYNYTIPRRYQPVVSEIIRKHYFGDRPIDNSTVESIVHLVTDRLFKSDAEMAAELQAKITNKVWFYDFGYRQKYSLSDTLSNTTINWGVAHLDDLAYVLDAFFNSTTTQKDREMQKVFLKLWLSFAYKKRPEVGVRWDKVNPEQEFDFLHILGPKKIFMDKSNNFGQEKFWRSIRFNENENYRPLSNESP